MMDFFMPVCRSRQQRARSTGPRAGPSKFFPGRGRLSSILAGIDFWKTLHPPHPEQCVWSPRYYARCPMCRFGAINFNTSQISRSATLGPEMIPKAILLMTMKGKSR